MSRVLALSAGCGTLDEGWFCTSATSPHTVIHVWLFYFPQPCWTAAAEQLCTMHVPTHHDGTVGMISKTCVDITHDLSAYGAVRREHVQVRDLPHCNGLGLLCTVVQWLYLHRRRTAVVIMTVLSALYSSRVYILSGVLLCYCTATICYSLYRTECHCTVLYRAVV